MRDHYGNYFCQTLIRTVGSEQRLTLLRALKPFFTDVACHTIGTHAMQRLIETLCQDEEKKIVYQSIETDIKILAYDSKGNYVLTSVMNLLKDESCSAQLNLVIERILPEIPNLINN